jgi:hypothetical protein
MEWRANINVKGDTSSLSREPRQAPPALSIHMKKFIKPELFTRAQGASKIN